MSIRDEIEASIPQIIEDPVATLAIATHASLREAVTTAQMADIPGALSQPHALSPALAAILGQGATPDPLPPSEAGNPENGQESEDDVHKAFVEAQIAAAASAQSRQDADAFPPEDTANPQMPDQEDFAMEGYQAPAETRAVPGSGTPDPKDVVAVLAITFTKDSIFIDSQGNPAALGGARLSRLQNMLRRYVRTKRVEINRPESIARFKEGVLRPAVSEGEQMSREAVL